ncbi:MAG: hypothetical protein R3F07_08945 [Opitutaceae bacterium]
MAKSAPLLDWCIVRLGEDLNWWVEEISDDIHWDVDGLSIIDPRQVSHILELLEPLRDYGFDADIFDMAFISFGIDKDLGKGRIRLTRVKDSLLESDDKLFALPDVMDEETGPYADFIDHIMKTRVKMLNDTFEFEQSLTVDEVEDELREAQNNSLIEGTSVHLYDEVIAILDYVPAGWEVDDDEDDKAGGEDEDDFPDIDEHEDDEEAEKLKGDESLRWDEEEEDEEDDDDSEDEDDEDLDEDDEDLDDEDEDIGRKAGKRRR